MEAVIFAWCQDVQCWAVNFVPCRRSWRGARGRCVGEEEVEEGKRRAECDRDAAARGRGVLHRKRFKPFPHFSKGGVFSLGDTVIFWSSEIVKTLLPRRDIVAKHPIRPSSESVLCRSRA